MADDPETDPRKFVLVQVNVKRSLNDLMEKAIEMDTHNTRAEFVRDAIREKLEKMGLSLTPEAQ